MIYKFYACGHRNILAAHKTTLEFTKDSELTLKGDCIVGIKADFNLDAIKEFIKKSKDKKIAITIKRISNAYDNDNEEKIDAEINPGFSSDNELVIRKTNFFSERTFAVNSNKAASDLDRSLISYLKESGNKIVVIIENKPV